VTLLVNSNLSRQPLVNKQMNEEDQKKVDARGIEKRNKYDFVYIKQ
jgi:hypothetical protein